MRQLVPPGPDIDDAESLERLYLLPPAPHVRVNFVASLDSVIVVAGRSSPLGGDADHAAFMAMRAAADVVLVGAGTVRAERYRPVRLGESVQERRRQRGQAALPPIAIVTARGALSPEHPVFGPGPKPILLTSAKAAQDHPDLGDIADIVECGSESVDSGCLLGELQRRGLSRVLCEGGPTLFNSLLRDGRVDELCLTFAPLLAGPGHRRLTGDEALPEPVDFELTSVLEGDGMLLCRYTARVAL